MTQLRTLSGFFFGAMLLAACETFPISTGGIVPAAPVPCPAYAPGQGPLEAPFPTACMDMQSSPSGLRWIELTAGEDQSRGAPGPDATVVVTYEGFLASDGTLIDSSYERGEPGVFDVPQLLPGWGEAIQMMTPGDEWMVYLPWPIAYGAEAVDDVIPAQSDIIYRMKLEGFLTAEEMAAEVQASEDAALLDGPDMAAWEAVFPWDPDAEGVNKLASGVSYVRLETSNSSMRNALITDDVLIHYEGRLAETSDFFDSSWSRGEANRFPVGGLIPGFTEALTYMKPGDRIIVHIPADQAYGAEGSGEVIPPNSDLMFQINMLEIYPADPAF